MPTPWRPRVVNLSFGFRRRQIRVTPVHPPLLAYTGSELEWIKDATDANVFVDCHFVTGSLRGLYKRQHRSRARRDQEDRIAWYDTSAGAAGESIHGRGSLSTQKRAIRR